jgi:hypothetical protein
VRCAAGEKGERRGKRKEGTGMRDEKGEMGGKGK